jgi:hypothetical protein
VAEQSVGGLFLMIGAEWRVAVHAQLASSADKFGPSVEGAAEKALLAL